jgi:acyl carrier protein
VPSTKDRIRSLVKENLEIDQELNFDAKFSEANVSSVDAIAFLKLINKEFNLTIPPEDFVQIQTLRELVAYLDTHAG